MKHLIMRLEAPLIACGGETIDNYGVIRAFPAASMLTGLLANALGWRRTEGERHQTLQDRLVFAARIDREPAGQARLQDYLTARLTNAKHWTTRGEPEGRLGGGGASFTHLRFRDYFADMRLTVALRLEPPDTPPALDELAAALERPARPPFIGRKPCLPSAPLFHGFSDGVTALTALLAVPADDRKELETTRLSWPENDTPETVTDVRISRTYMLTDRRNWRASGLHGGGRLVCEGTIASHRLPAPETAAPRTGKDEKQ